MAIAKKKHSKQSQPRIGRPPRELAGEVDDRILDAARRVFLEQGFGGASIDEIARIARAGKPTIYARFATKEALFAAVGNRNAANVRGNFESYVPKGTTLKERLVSVGTEVLNRLLVSEAIDFMRLAVAEVRRFPELGNVGRMARERGIHAVAAVLKEVASSVESTAFPAFAPDRAAETTQFFIDLIVERHLIRALFGESIPALRAEIDTHVERCVAFFLAACRR
jgi:AcrR family transcriptional regulator